MKPHQRMFLSISDALGVLKDEVKGTENHCKTLKLRKTTTNEATQATREGNKISSDARKPY